MCRDLDVLTRLDRRNHVSIYVSLISADPRLIRLFEARSPMPHARLRALRTLTDAGLRAGLIVAPVLPGLTDSTRRIERLMAAAREANAAFVFPSVLRLYPATRQRYLPILETHCPALAKRYRAAYGRGPDAPAEYVSAVRRRFRRLARKYGIPETDGNREQEEVEGSTRPGAQLSLFAAAGDRQ